MARIRFTGLGWLSIPIVFASVLLGAFLAGRDPGGAAMGLSIACALLVTAPVHWLIGAALNSRATPHGRVWHDRHTIEGMPMQKAAGFHVAVALLAVGIVVGGATSWILGVAVVVGVPIAVIVVAGRLGGRRQVRPLADRKALATQRGWRYRDRDTKLAIRWRSPRRRGAPYSARPFGIVAGTLNRLPFTAFDSELDGVRYTNWAVHMPVAFPRLVVWGEAPPRGEPPLSDVFDQFFAQPGGAAQRHAFAQMAQHPEVEADDPAFAAALATPEVRQATVATDLRGWLIDGRDLILSRSYRESTPCRAVELVGVADQLTSLFYRFGSDAQRWATEPSTAVPLEDAAR